MLETFTITAAARLLEKDRETLVRALRRVPPDTVGKTRGRDREQWRMATIIAALERHSEGGASSRSNNLGPVVHHDWLIPSHWRDSRCVTSIVEFNEAFAKLKTIKDAKARRAFAVEKIAPLIDHHDKHFRKQETDCPAPGKFWNDHDSVSARVSLLWSQEMELVQEACGWTSEQGRKLLHDPYNTDADG
jgi:hypothetical protein